MQRRHSCSVRRATQAGIIGAHDGRDSIEHALAQFRAVDEVLGDLFDAASDREVIVPCGDDEIGPADRTVFVHLVVMDQSNPWRFDHADAFEGVPTRFSTNVDIQCIWLLQKDLHALQGVQDLD